jgi:hypothetical protein
MPAATFLIVVVLAVFIGRIRSTATSSDDEASQVREVSGIREVVLSTAGALVIEQGSDESLAIEANPTTASKITTTVRGSRLEIGSPNSIRASESITYRLRVKDLSAIELSGEGRVEAHDLKTSRLKVVSRGAGDVRIDGLNCDDLRVATYGAGSIRLTGTVTSQQVALFGAGGYIADQLRSQDTTVELRGAGRVAVNATGSLDVGIWGNGVVEYTGNPRLNQSVSGIGRVTKRG